MRILFISYYFYPTELVGAKRLSYWSQNIKSVNSSFQHVSVITSDKLATIVDSSIDDLFVIEASDSVGSFRIDIGTNWLKNLRPFLRNHLKSNHYDVVVISGNPFGHFGVMNLFEREKTKIVLDFRDPFANNPRAIRTKYSPIKNFFYSLLEYHWIDKSFKTIMINKYCSELLRFKKKIESKLVFIDNGYDERCSGFRYSLSKTDMGHCGSLNLAYSGSLYKDRMSSAMGEYIKRQNGNVTLHLIGSVQDNWRFDHVKVYGPMSYEENLRFLKTFDILVLFATGHAFESSTKIFDYIGLKKPILVVFNKLNMSGSIRDILHEYPVVEFCNNSYGEIDISISKLRTKMSLSKCKMELDAFNSCEFSRRSGLEKLAGYFG